MGEGRRVGKKSRKQLVLCRYDPGQQTNQPDYCHHCPDNRGVRLLPSRSFRVRQQDIADDRDGKCKMPEEVEPAGSLRPGSKKTSWAECARKNQNMRSDHQPNEKIATCEDQQCTRSDSRELAKQ